MTCTPSNPCDPQDDLRYEIDGTCTNTPASPDEGVDICIIAGGDDEGCEGTNPIVIMPDAEGEDNNCFNTTQDFDQNIVLCFDYDKFDWEKIDKEVLKDVLLEDICCLVAECIEENRDEIIGKTLCLVEGEENLYLDDDSGCLGFTQPDDPDPEWPIYGARMFGHIAPDGPLSAAQGKITFASKGPDGKNCVEINQAKFQEGEGGNIVWMVDLKFTTPLKTEEYEVFLTPGDGSYDHIMTYLKDDNAKQGFKVFMHDVENNVTAGEPGQPDGNHVASFSFMVIF